MSNCDETCPLCGSKCHATGSFIQEGEHRNHWHFIGDSVSVHEWRVST